MDGKCALGSQVTPSRASRHIYLSPENGTRESHTSKVGRSRSSNGEIYLCVYVAGGGDGMTECLIHTSEPRLFAGARSHPCGVVLLQGCEFDQINIRMPLNVALSRAGSLFFAILSRLDVWSRFAEVLSDVRARSFSRCCVMHF